MFTPASGHTAESGLLRPDQQTAKTTSTHNHIDTQIHKHTHSQTQSHINTQPHSNTQTSKDTNTQTFTHSHTVTLSHCHTVTQIHRHTDTAQRHRQRMMHHDFDHTETVLPTKSFGRRTIFEYCVLVHHHLAPIPPTHQPLQCSPKENLFNCNFTQNFQFIKSKSTRVKKEHFLI